jgi:hypothetical protein
LLGTLAMSFASYNTDTNALRKAWAVRDSHHMDGSRARAVITGIILGLTAGFSTGMIDNRSQGALTGSSRSMVPPICSRGRHAASWCTNGDAEADQWEKENGWPQWTLIQARQ